METLALLEKLFELLAPAAGKLIELIAAPIKTAVEQRDVSTVDALRVVCNTDEQYAALDELLIGMQRDKNTGGLPAA